MRTPSKHEGRDGAVTYKVRFRHGRRQTSESFTTLKQAKKFAAWLDVLGPQGALDQLYAGEQVDYVPTLDELAADHIRHLTGIEPGTRVTYTRLWERTWAPLIGHLPANLATRDAIAEAVNELGNRYSAKSLKNQRGLLAAVLGRAVDQGVLTKNPVARMRLPRGQEGDAVEMRILDQLEFSTVALRMHPHHQPLLRFLYGTGCRWGEAVALEVRDVQLPNVRIRRAVKWSPEGGRTVGATKTRKSNRTVLIPPALHGELDMLCAGRASTDLVFTAPRGGPVLHRTFWSDIWLPAVKHLDPRPRIHDLRHSHASLLLANGTPIHVVQARLGHESIQTTVDTYSHLLPDAQLAAAAAADQAFGVLPSGA
ncbi:site-specific integrase [uncultured Nocardioides sp.]|uniref:tyrosine-type recombinase/integrase n=1 Tax=uncultured Nocardioides sp. TaxID=198441 RepID=UPI002611A3CB|nr:site-specific integrase [uncultured Nocardioides sp.]